jgi:hypothetical protein
MLLGMAGCGRAPGSAEAKKLGPPGLPINAKLIVETAGGFAYIAPQAGTAYVYDQRSRRVVFSTAMSFGDQFFFDPEKKRIVAGGRIIQRDDLKADRVHQLYFAGG